MVKVVKGGKTPNGLNQEQEAFCQCYVNSDKEFFGNGVRSYIQAYGPDQTKKNWYNTARSVASEILTNPNIIKRINELLEDQGLNDTNVDKQLGFLVNQYSDFSSKLGAIREYNRLKTRVNEGMQVNINIDTATDEELIGMLKK